MKIPRRATIFFSLALMACGATDRVSAPTLAATPPAPSAPGGDPPINTLVLTGAANLAPGEVATLSITALSADGRVANEGTVTWETTNATVATITSTGTRTAKLSAIIPGTTQIIARLNGFINSVTIGVAADVPGQNDGVTAAFIYSAKDGMQYIKLPTGATAIYANAINDAGQVVGSVTYGNNSQHAFLWSAAEGLKDFFPDNNGYSSATAISSDGQVAGQMDVNQSTHSFRWTRTAGLLDLGREDVYAYGINSSGVVVGFFVGTLPQPAPFPAYQGDIPFKWTEASGFQPLSVDGTAIATAINDAGQIAGALTGDDEFAGLILWSPSESRTTPRACACGGLALNSEGVVAGVSSGKAFTWSANVGSVTVPGVPSSDYSSASAINDQGLVAGSIWSSVMVGTVWVHQNRGFLYDHSAGAAAAYSELAAPRGRTSLYITGVNNKGQVVGFVE